MGVYDEVVQRSTVLKQLGSKEKAAQGAKLSGSGDVTTIPPLAK